MKLQRNQQINSCLISGNPVIPIINLGMHPYADTFVGSDQLHLSEPVLPLVCNLSESTGLIQLGYVSNDWDRYNLYSYSYTSSNGTYSRQHWQQMAQDIQNKLNITSGHIVEIGSNDGYLLSQFPPAFSVLGVDASENMCDISNQRGVPARCGIFGREMAWDLISRGPADVIVANNVLNHANNPVDFVQGVRELLAPDGWFVFEVPDWGWMMQQERYDMIYHEHVNYFTQTSLYHLLKQADLEIKNVDLIDYHGQSLRVWAKYSHDSTKATKELVDSMGKERSQGLFSVEFYKKFSNSMIHNRHSFLNKLLTIKMENPNRPIIGVGAAAKANTWLNYHSINHLLLDYVTDSSPQKQGKYTPLSRIPIVSDEIFAQYDQPYALILSWNISNQLRENILSINNRTEFINL